MENLTQNDYDAAMGDTQLPADYTQFAELMIKDPKIPAAVKKAWWGYINQDTILSRSDKEDKWAFQNSWVIQRNVEMMSRPAYRVDINELKSYENIRNRYTTQVNRSFGGFERQALMTQIKELRTNRTASENNPGFLTKLSKRLGFGKKEEMKNG